MILITPENTPAKKGRSPLDPDRSATEYALLGLLFGGPSHGYDLTRHFAPGSSLGKICRLEMSLLYGILKKLERDKMILGREEIVSPNKTRRVVELTEAGRKEFEEWLSSPVPHTREVRLGFLVKLFFARQRSQEFAFQLLDQQLEVTRNLLVQLVDQQNKLKNSSPVEDFEGWVLDFRIEQNTGVLHWLSHCRKRLLLPTP